MADTYTGNLNVESTAELNPYFEYLIFLDTPGTEHGLWDKWNGVATPTLPWDHGDVDLNFDQVWNKGDETIDILCRYEIDGTGEAKAVSSISADTFVGRVTMTIAGDNSALAAGSHTITWKVYAKKSSETDWRGPYYDNSTTYTVEEPEEPVGKITKVELDSQKLPEGGTLDWILNDDAAIKVYFKNTGNAASTFDISVTDEDGATLCSVTTEEIAADGNVYYIDCGTFTPDVEETKTLTTHIDP